MYNIALSFSTAFALTFFLLPSIISLARMKGLFDVPNSRSSHTVRTPSLGGIGIFVGTIFSIFLWTPFEDFKNLQYILCAFIIIFLIGAKDDISPISPAKKLIGQVLVAVILIFKADIRLSGFHGLFGMHEVLSEHFSVVLTIFTMLVIINAFNLIDGIDGLAGSIGALIMGTLGCWFFMADRAELSMVAFATTGAVIAFLKYNYSPAKIFMGDAGSLLIGLVSAILTIEFIRLNHHLDPGHPLKMEAIPAVAIGILILPLFDMLRVFTTRIIRGCSPFKPDRRHIHHLLVDLGFSHMEATACLVFTNILFITFVLTFNRQLDLHALLAFIIALAAGMTYYLHKSAVQKKLEKNEER